MTAVQTPAPAHKVPAYMPEAAITPTYAAQNEAVMSAELQAATPKRWLWTRRKYYQAGEAGIFGPDERLELIEGEVFHKVSPQSSPHAVSVGRAAQAMRRSFSDAFHVREEKPIILNDLSEPEPDIAVVRGTLDDDWQEHSAPADIVLLIEVSVSTLQTDQTLKAAIYALAGIADHWILNVPARQLEVRRDPSLLDSGEVGYRSVRIIAHDGQVSPLATAEVVINVADMLPRQL